MSDEHFLSRWSRLKHETKAKEQVDAESPDAPAPVPAVPAEPALAPAEPVALPPVASLTPDSDFSPFMTANVDSGVRRDALKKLFTDPRFNVMDGLDVYIDDYTKPDPLPEGWLEKMNQVARLGAFVEKPEPAAEKPAATAAETPPGLEQAAAISPVPETPEGPPASDTRDEVPSLVSVRKS